MSKTKLGYKDYQSALTRLGELATQQQFPKIIVLYGTSDFLQQEALHDIRGFWLQRKNSTVNSLDTARFDQSTLEQIWTQDAIFEPQALYVLQKLEKKTDLPKYFEAMPSTQPKGGLCLTLQTSAAPVKLLNALKGRSFLDIPCFEPSYYEVDRYLEQQIRKHRLKMNSEAVQLFRQSVGLDLATIQNELQKMALVFADFPGLLTAQEVGPILGFLRQDMIFHLEKLVLSRKSADALAMVSSLLNRGESALGILAVLASLVRKALRINQHLRQGHSPEQAASAQKLPLPVIKSYNQYMSQKSPMELIKVLRLCQQADQQLKGSGIAGDLVLGQIVLAL